MGKPREWFTLENTPRLTPEERRVLNRAARMFLFGTTKSDLSRNDLMKIRSTFEPGMSASDILSSLGGTNGQ